MTPQNQFHHDHAEINRIRLHYVEAGEGPAVLFCHGFPELWYSWRHQLPAFAANGLRAIALDMRGHGESGAPDDLDAYDVLHNVGDVIGLLDHLNIDRAFIVGHDAGTTTAYHSALMRPDRVAGVAGLSVPYLPRGPVNMLEVLKEAVPPGFYMNYFQQPGVAEKDLEADPRESLLRLIYANSGENPDSPIVMLVPEGGTLTETLASPDSMPAFLSSADLDIYAAAYAKTGFRGGLNGYRVIGHNWERTAPWACMPLPVPSCYIGGTADTVLNMPGMREAADQMDETHILDGAGHWIQAERAEAVNDILLAFADKVLRG